MKWIRPAPGTSIEVRGSSLVKGVGPRTYDFYEPDEALFRNFADLPLDDDGALAIFANRYGFLTLRKFHPGKGERFSFWREQIFKVKAVVELNELISNPRRLNRIAQPTLRNDVFRVLVPFDESKGWEIGLAPELANQIRTNTHRVRYVIGSEIERAFRKYPTTLNPQWDQSESKLNLLPNPASLLALIWYQVATSVAEELENLTKCERCGTWFPSQRSTRKTCSDRCRKAMSRRKK